MVLITPNYLFFISVSLIVFFKSIIKFSYIIVYQGRRKVWKSRVARSIVGGHSVPPPPGPLATALLFVCKKYCIDAYICEVKFAEYRSHLFNFSWILANLTMTLIVFSNSLPFQSDWSQKFRQVFPSQMLT